MTFVLTSVAHLYAEVKLPAVLGDHMVVQRDKPINVWGWADAEDKVVVSFAGSKESAVADSDGNWKVVLKAKKATAKPQGMQVNHFWPQTAYGIGCSDSPDQLFIEWICD